MTAADFAFRSGNTKSGRFAGCFCMGTALRRGFYFYFAFRLFCEIARIGVRLKVGGSIGWEGASNTLQTIDPNSGGSREA
jgi:hypothetical protein